MQVIRATSAGHLGFNTHRQTRHPRIIPRKVIFPRIDRIDRIDRFQYVQWCMHCTVNIRYRIRDSYHFSFVSPLRSQNDRHTHPLRRAILAYRSDLIGHRLCNNTRLLYNGPSILEKSWFFSPHHLFSTWRLWLHCDYSMLCPPAGQRRRGMRDASYRSGGRPHTQTKV